MKYVKFSFFTILVMIVEFGISYLLANKFNFKVIDAMFYVGVVFTLFSIFFSSTGGLFTNYSEMTLSTSFTGVKNNYKFKRTFGSLSVNYFNLGSVLFLLIDIVVAFYL